MDAPCRIRPATLADAPALARLERAAFTDPWSEASLREILGAPLAFGAVAEAGAGPAGYAMARVVAGEGEVLNLAVDPSWRRRGIGGDLLRHLLARFDAEGVVAAFLEVRESNLAALGLYQGHGFEVAGRREGYYRRPVEAALLLRRDRRGVA